MYDLHIICGVNELVCGPEFCSDRDDDLSFAPFKFFYSHVNFLATQRDSQSAERDPALFFAEFDNEDDGKVLKCCRVDMPLPYTGTLLFVHSSFILMLCDVLDGFSYSL